MTSTPATKVSPAYFLQAVLAFSIALAVVVIGEIYLPVPGWTRAFLALGTVFLVSATFTLSKCVRDQQETESVVSRIDAARIERLLAEFDPYRVPGVPTGGMTTAGVPAAGVPMAGPPPAPTDHRSAAVANGFPPPPPSFVS